MMFLVYFLLLANVSNAYFEHSQNPSQEMNGISYEAHKNFPTDWKLITVRYREDSGELRLTYANEIAVKAMNSLKPNYPDGAKFGKVSYLTEDDPAFPSSKIPAGTRRFQLMVKNRKLYGSTNNWGYALFDENGKLFNENIKTKTEACAACHQLVPERDYVFSRPLQHRNQTTIPASGIKFEARPVTSFKGIDLSSFKGKEKMVESLEGPLQKHAFSGTLDEVVPLLSQRAKLTGKNSILFINDKNFTVVRPEEEGKSKCQESQNLVSVLIYFNGAKVREASHCQ